MAALWYRLRLVVPTNSEPSSTERKSLGSGVSACQPMTAIVVVAARRAVEELAPSAARARCAPRSPISSEGVGQRRGRGARGPGCTGRGASATSSVGGEAAAGSPPPSAGAGPGRGRASSSGVRRP